MMSPRRALIPLIVACGLFMENLDSTVIATALPAIAQSLGAFDGFESDGGAIIKRSINGFKASEGRDRRLINPKAGERALAAEL